MGMQVSRCDSAKISSKNDLWKPPMESRRDPSRFVSAEKYRSGGRHGDARSYSYAPERSTELQHSHGNRVFERQECNSNPSPPVENERDIVRSIILGPWLFC